MKEAHRSYKPCRNFASNRCEYDGDCSFYHIILEKGEHICYRCAHKTKSRTEMMRHIKNEHGNIICHRFLRNQCNFGSQCLYSHSVPSAQNVQRNRANSHSDSTHVPTAQDFPDTLTSGPVVGAQGGPQIQTPAQPLHHVSQDNQQSIQSLTSQMVIMMNQMNHIQAILAAMN